MGSPGASHVVSMIDILKMKNICASWTFLVAAPYFPFHFLLIKGSYFEIILYIEILHIPPPSLA